MRNDLGFEDSKHWLQFSSVQCNRETLSLDARIVNKRLLIVKQALYLLAGVQTRMKI